MKAIYRVILMAVLCVAGLNVNAQVPGGFVTNGLIAYYPLNGNVTDASGNGNDGTVTNATPTQDRFGVQGMAYQFNGSNSYILANVPNLPTGASPRSVSLWAKAQPIAGQGAALIWWGYTQGYDPNGAFTVLNNGPLFNSGPYSWQGGGEGGGSGVDSGVAVDTNWHNVVVVYDGSTMEIWLDGVSFGANSLTINTPLSPLFIGAFDEGAIAAYFSGAINEVRVYDRALSPQEISELYQSFAMGILPGPTITITGNVSQIYSIQYVTDLSSTNWTTLVSNIVLQSSSYIYPDASAVGQPQRFYRVVAQ